MIILVTGGAGYIGSHVVKQLSEAGHQVIVYDNLSTGFADSLLHREELIHADLTDVSTLAEVFKKYQIDSVMHFAASIIVPESVANPLKYYRNNTVNTLNLLQACVEHNVQRFIFSSTAAVYQESESGFVDERSSTVPISPYGKSKLMSEWIIKDLAQTSNMKYMILRYFNVAGADPKTRIGQRSKNATHLIKVCSQAALGLRDFVEIYGIDYPTKDGTGIRDYIHVEDLASAHLAALDYLSKGNASDLLNVGYGTGISVREVINAIQHVSGKKFAIKESARRPGDIAMLVAKAERIKQLLGWQPRHTDIEQIIADSWRWERKSVA